MVKNGLARLNVGLNISHNTNVDRQVMVTATREWPTPLLATGGLDGFVRVWSVADDGRIRPLLACSGFGQPYSLAALRG